MNELCFADLPGMAVNQKLDLRKGKKRDADRQRHIQSYQTMPGDAGNVVYETNWRNYNKPDRLSFYHTTTPHVIIR
jgi:hypothetical protein